MDTALHGSGMRRARLLASAVGYFLGIERPDWALKGALTPDVKVTAYTVTADTISVACGRISFALGLHGPCVSMDTACASGLARFYRALGVEGGGGGVRGGLRIDHVLHAIVGTPTTEGYSSPRRVSTGLRQPLMAFAEVHSQS